MLWQCCLLKFGDVALVDLVTNSSESEGGLSILLSCLWYCLALKLWWDDPVVCLVVKSSHDFVLPCLPPSCVKLQRLSHGLWCRLLVKSCNSSEWDQDS